MNLPQLPWPTKNLWIESFLPHWNRTVNLISWILKDVLRKLSLVTNKILLYSAIGTLITGAFYKYLRAIPGFGRVENMNYLFLVPIFFFLPYYFIRNKLLKLDALMFLSAFTLSLTYTIAGSLTLFQDQLIIIAAYIMPILAYFLFRYLNISEKLIVSTVFYFVGISFVLILTEFITNNYIGFSVFAFKTFLSESRGLEIDRIVRNIPLLGPVMGIWGNCGTTYATAGLFVAFFFYGAAIYRYRPQFKKKAIFIMIFSFIPFYLCGSKTAYMVFIVMLGLFYYGFNSIVLGTMFIIGFGIVLTLMFTVNGYTDTMNALDSGIFKSIELFISALFQTDSKYWFYVLFGQGFESRVHASEFKTEIAYFEQLLQVGVFNYVLLIAILITYTGSILNIRNGETRNSHIPGLIFIVTLIFGSLHYEALFKYPSNLIATSFMGYAMSALGRSRLREVHSS